MRKIGVIEKPRARVLKEFKEEFFKTEDFKLGESGLGCFFESFSPLCGICETACEAVDILFNMLRDECFQLAEVAKDVFFSNVNWIKMIKIDKHILNEFEKPTSVQGVYIMKLAKERFGRLCMTTQIRNVMNGNEKAFEKVFGEKMGEVELEGADRLLVGKWNWLCPDKFSKDAKVGFRKVADWFEIKASICIATEMASLSQLVWDLRKRKSWDIFLQDFTVIQKSSNRCQVQYNIQIGRKSSVKLLLDTQKVEDNEKVKIIFRSAGEGEGVGRIRGCYKAKNVDTKLRTGSSSTDDAGSSNAENRTLACLSVSSACKDNLKLQLKLKLTPELAKHIVSDLCEETSYLKTSLKLLKDSAELLNNYQ